MLALLAFTSPIQADLIDHTYWASIPNPPFFIVGYKVLPLYMGPTELCIKISQQTWAFALPPKEDFQTLVGLFTALSLSMNHVYTTETLGKEL